jgi:G3E family GTPase
VGCSLAASLVASIKEFRQRFSPDFLFIEPSELVVTSEMRAVTAMALRDIRYEIGPFIILVNGPGFGALWQARQPLLLRQVAGADLVAVSKADLLGPARLEEIATALQSHCDGVLLLSARTGSGMKEVMDIIREA